MDMLGKIGDVASSGIQSATKMATAPMEKLKGGKGGGIPDPMEMISKLIEMLKNGGETNKQQ